MATEDRSRESSSPENSPDTVAPVVVNKFSNDGSFLEMFKKQMKEQNKTKSLKESAETPKLESSVTVDKVRDAVKAQCVEASASNSEASQKKPNFYAFVGKRRGGAPVLKTGAVKKQKKELEEPQPPSDTKGDAWASYLQEVQKYKSRSCQDEDRTRPLVK